MNLKCGCHRWFRSSFSVFLGFHSVQTHHITSSGMLVDGFIKFINRKLSGRNTMGNLGNDEDGM